MKKTYLAVYYSLVTEDVAHRRIVAESDEKAWAAAEKLQREHYSKYYEESFDLYINVIDTYLEGKRDEND